MEDDWSRSGHGRWGRVYLQRTVMVQQAAEFAAGPNYEDKTYHTDGHCAPQSANPIDLTTPQ